MQNLNTIDGVNLDDPRVREYFFSLRALYNDAYRQGYADAANHRPEADDAWRARRKDTQNDDQ